MKEIKELFHDEKSCEKILQFFVKSEDDVTLNEIELYDYWSQDLFDDEDDNYQINIQSTDDNGDFIFILITESGVVSPRKYIDNKYELIEYNPFAFVQLINELGYSPKQL